MTKGKKAPALTGKHEPTDRDKTRKDGKIAREVQILPGDMLQNVERIRSVFNALKIPNPTRARPGWAWGYSDTITMLAEYGAAHMILDADFQRLEREAEEARRAERKESAIIDSIMNKGPL